MNKKQLLLIASIFALGLLGVLSITTMELPLPPELLAELEARFTPLQIKLLTLINPTIMLLVASLLGVLLHEKVNLQVPIIKGWVDADARSADTGAILKSGLLGGLLAGGLLSLAGLVFYPMLPQEFIELGERLQPSLAARFLYGGITEEILMRFGLMTFLVWLASKIFKNTSNTVFWLGIMIAAVIFGLGHLPIAFQAVGTPSSSLVLYIILGNTIGGVIFGWLYWKRGLESAIIAHMITHVVMLSMEPLISS